MLGLSDKKTYEAWTAFFEPTSTWEGTWDEGGKIIFTSNAGEEKSGMVARILKNDPAKMVSINHYGMLEKGEEITDGPKMEGWGDALENYWFEQTADGTKVIVEVDMKEEYAKQMDEIWPKALAKLKEICE